MSSETPAEPDRTTSDASTEARPRRALAADHTPGSPTTPVRFPSRAENAQPDSTTSSSTPSGDTASDTADDEAPTRTWTWEVPADDAADDAAPKNAQPTEAEPSPPVKGRRAHQESGDDAGTDPSTSNDTADNRSKPDAASSPGNGSTDDKQGAPAQKPAAKKPAKKAAAGKGRGGKGKPGQGKPGQGKPGQGKPGQGKPGQGKGGGARKPGGQLPTRRKQFRLLQGMGPMERRPEIPDQSHLPAEQRTDLAIKVNDLSITYRTSFEKKPTLRQALTRFGRGQRAVREVEALKGVSFEVRTGTAMGIIGANGAGKSTLMRAMAGILPPTTGSVEVWGRASTLLALGVGFNNSLSGRENIILGGLAAGLSREAVEERADEIADWTELGDFIDMPMRTYSSGMFSRVAFSVAVHMEPDILMIDEALSTGDAHFKEKASAKMSELRSKARAMFLVSHGLNSIKDLCDEAIWIDKGRLMQRGEPNEIVDLYLDHMKAKRSAAAMDDF